MQLGQEKFKSLIEQALAASDLFFGLVNALLQSTPPTFIYYKITEQVLYEERYQKIKGASENFTAKLLEINKTLKSKDISFFADNLQSFFAQENNRVKWIELSEKHCSFISMPIEIEDLVKSILKPFKKVSFADILEPDILPKFFITRLGLSGFTLQSLANKQTNKTAKKSSPNQGDLFAGLKRAFAPAKPKLIYSVQSQTAKPEDIFNIIKNGKVLPSAVLFSSPMQVREFYDQYYQDLKAMSSVLAQSNSGGSNKIFRNFAINPKSILLATDKLILKSLANQASVEPVTSLKVRALIICRLPFEQFSHPYQEAVSQSMPNAFMDYALPKAVLNFYNLIKFFYSSELEHIYVMDPKLSKEYSEIFKSFYKYIPGSKIDQ